MNQHRAKVRAEIIGQMVPAVVLMKPNTWRVLFLFGTVHEINSSATGPRETLVDLEEFAIARISGEHRVRAVFLRRFCRSFVLGLNCRVLHRQSHLPILANVPLQGRQTADLHATYREFLTCFNEKYRRKFSVCEVVEAPDRQFLYPLEEYEISENV